MADGDAASAAVSMDLQAELLAAATETASGASPAVPGTRKFYGIVWSSHDLFAPYMHKGNIWVTSYYALVQRMAILASEIRVPTGVVRYVRIDRFDGSTPSVLACRKLTESYQELHKKALTAGNIVILDYADAMVLYKLLTADAGAFPLPQALQVPLADGESTSHTPPPSPCHCPFMPSGPLPSGPYGTLADDATALPTYAQLRSRLRRFPT